MRYFTYPEKEYEEYSHVYLELDREGYCLRAIYEGPRMLTTTNFVTENNWELLPEGAIENPEDVMATVSAALFETKWQAALALYREQWKTVKSIFQPEQKVTATVNVFYPQGVILNIPGTAFHGLADYEMCKERWGTAKMYPYHTAELVIEGYDEKNMWILLRPL